MQATSAFSVPPTIAAYTHTVARRQTLFLSAITLFGLGLRLPLLSRFGFHPDEALYSVWALHALQVDPFFLQVWPDKPPLFLWFLSGAFTLWGVGEANARLLNILLSVVTIPVVGALATHLWGRRAAPWAALAYALNPFAISFAPTVFTDPLLVLAGTLALLLAILRRPGWAGCWLGVAIMTKQQGLFYLPLIAGAWVIAEAHSERRWVAGCARFLLGLGVVIGPILYWDSLRWAVAPSPWDLGARNYAALAWVAVQAWPERGRRWGELLWYLTASWPVWLMLAGGLGWLLWQTRRSWPRQNQRHLEWWGLILLWSAGFLLLHLASTMQIWDRYLLPLAPLIAALIGGLAASSMTVLRPPQRWVGALLLLALLLPPALHAADGRLPIGSDHGAYRELSAAMAWLRTNADNEVVLYHRELGWHTQFYLFDELLAGSYQLRWFPHAVYLADNSSKAPHRQRILIQPDWAPVRDLTLHLAVRGLQAHKLAQFGHFVIFEINEAAADLCDWCACQSRAWWANLPPIDAAARMCRS